jgi:hypothetical protein
VESIIIFRHWRQAKSKKTGWQNGSGATSKKRSELIDLPAGRINDRQLQVSDRPLVPMLDPLQHSLQVVRDALRASAGVCDH